MCGIFGFALRKHIPIIKVFKVLEKLEVHQYLHETKPVGGYGSGVAVLGNNGKVVLEKAGRISDSPVRRLSETVKIRKASVLVAHVRMPSPQFMKTAKFKETAQPYVTKCNEGLTVVSAHNGNITNYKEIKEKLGETHIFESEKVELIDSEVIPHFFEELLKEKVNANDALDSLFSTLEGPSAASLLQIEKGHVFLHLIHKGKTRGLIVWTNAQDEVLFCSRKEPVMEEIGDLIVRRRFEEKLAIPYHEDVSVRLSFPLGILSKG